MLVRHAKIGSLCVASLVAVLSARAGNREFPRAGGDIASAADWGGSLPTSADVVLFPKAGTYTASADMTFSRFRINGTGSTFDFGPGTDRTITLCTAYSNLGTFDMPCNFATNTVCGGTLKLTAGSFYLTYPGNHTERLTLDGTKVEVANGQVYVGPGDSHDCVLALTNGASVSAANCYVTANGSGYGNQVEVNAGSTFQMGNVYMDQGGTRSLTSGRGLLLVRGENALAKVTGAIYGGYRHDGNVVRATAGGVLSAGNYYTDPTLGASASSALDTHGHLLQADDGGALDFGGYVQIGNNSCDNRLVVDNGTLTCKYLQIGVCDTSSNNVAQITGGSAVTLLNGGSLQIGKAGSHNALVVSNSTLSLTTAWKDPFGAGRDNLFELASCSTCLVASVTSSAILRDAVASTFRVTGGSVVQTPRDNLEIGGTNGVMTAESGNRFEIGADAEYGVYRFFLVGHDNTMAISNGTFSVDYNSGTAFVVGSENVSGCAVSNNVVRFEGDHPRLRFTAAVSGGVYLRNGSRLQFVLPADGYADVPIVCSQLDVSSDCEIDIDVSAFDAARDGAKRVFNLVGVRYNSHLLDESVLERANARLPEGYSLKWLNGYLAVVAKSTLGMLMFVR